jgi:hypothetical protein
VQPQFSPRAKSRVARTRTRPVFLAKAGDPRGGPTPAAASAAATPLPSDAKVAPSSSSMSSVAPDDVVPFSPGSTQNEDNSDDGAEGRGGARSSTSVVSSAVPGKAGDAPQPGAEYRDIVYQAS